MKESFFPGTFEVGDIFSTSGAGVAGWCSSHLFLPPTHRFHFGLLMQPYKGYDWVTLESTPGKGTQLRLLSDYSDTSLQVYRVDAPEDVRHAAPETAIALSRDSKYDFLFYPELAWSVVKAWCRNRSFQPLWARELGPYHRWCSEVVCTLMVWLGYGGQGWDILEDAQMKRRAAGLVHYDGPPIPPIPSAYMEALQAGAMQLLWSNYYIGSGK
jgi:hypothetical protein